MVVQLSISEEQFEVLRPFLEQLDEVKVLYLVFKLQSNPVEYSTEQLFIYTQK